MNPTEDNKPFVTPKRSARALNINPVTAIQPLAYSVRGAADSINASKGLLYNAIKLYAKDPKRGLRARKLMGRTVILQSDLMDWLNRLPVKTAPSATHSERGHQRWAAAQRPPSRDSSCLVQPGVSGGGPVTV